MASPDKGKKVIVTKYEDSSNLEFVREFLRTKGIKFHEEEDDVGHVRIVRYIFAREDRKTQDTAIGREVTQLPAKKTTARKSTARKPAAKMMSQIRGLTSAAKNRSRCCMKRRNSRQTMPMKARM